MPKFSDGKTVVEIPGQANVDLQQYIIGNSKGVDYIPGQSPYVASNAALNTPATTSRPTGTTTATRCANGDLACISGVGQQQNAPITQQTKEVIADGAEAASRGAGVVAAGATVVATQGGPYGRPAAAAAAIATLLGYGADAVEQLIRPDPKKFFTEQIVIGVPAEILTHQFPLYAPAINEAAEYARQLKIEKVEK